MPNKYPRRPINDDRDPWDRQHKEPPRAFHVFCHYRDMPLGLRTVRRAFMEHREKCLHQTNFGKQHHSDSWSGEWGWVERAAAWDREMDRLARQKISQDQVNARTRHARIAQATLQVLSMPMVALMKAAEDPTVLQRLVDEARHSPKAFVKLMDLASWSSRGMPGMVDVERLALGLSTEAIDIREETRDDLGFDIPASPEAAELASSLLDQFARTRQRIAERAGVSGDAERDRRALGTGEAPHLPDDQVTGS